MKTLLLCGFAALPGPAAWAALLAGVGLLAFTLRRRATAKQLQAKIFSTEPPILKDMHTSPNSYRRSAHSPRFALWLAGLTTAGLLPFGSASLRAQTAATGALNQTATGTLFGSGSYSAPTLTLNGSLRPGDFGTVDHTVGTMTLNGQVGLLGSTSLVFDLAGTAASDQLQVNGALTLAVTLGVNAITGFSAGRYGLINYTGALTNNGLALGTLPAGYNYSIDTSRAGEVDLVVSTVPEPSTWAAMLAGTGFLALVLRRHPRG